MKKFSLLLLIVLVSKVLVQAQGPAQTVRGRIVDEVTQMPLPGVAVAIIDLNPVLGGITDLNGEFRITAVPVGRHRLRAGLVGYEEYVLPDIVVNSGKELVVQINMREQIIMMNEAVVVADQDKTKSLNEMSLVRTRTFSVEETQKFAAAVNDPARMATSFAGVVGTDDGNNNISIRGNSPNALQWRMEGVEIPNPNHFSFPGTAGGGISILSAQLLYNSDFLTGAFSAEYGNVLGGVFDLRLRKGNNERNEFTAQAGFLGLDIASEGPLSKRYNGSYLVNYRYSTLAAISRIIDLGDARTDFQDLSFNVYLPTKNAGQFTFFGFAGLSSQRYEAKADSTVWEDEGERYNSDFVSNTMAAGLTHSINLGKNSYLKTVLVGSYFGNDFKATRLNDEYLKEERERGHTYQDRQLLNSTFNHKFNARNSLRAGVIVSRLGFNISESSYDTDKDRLEQVLKVTDYTFTFQQFVNWQHRFNEQLTLQAGLHALQLALNSDVAIEPRASLSYALNNKNSFTLGYGLHSQIQLLGVYFGESVEADGSSVRYNENLGLSRSHHFVIGYDRMLNAWTHVKVEAYYQHLFRIPVSTDPDENFSMQNLLGGYYTDALSNDGRGRNYGAELTLEQFMRNDFYFLLSGSLYDSRYRDREGAWRNTRFNGNYACTFTAGKEWTSGP